MERMLSTEDKIKRAEEIYNRRKEGQIRNNTAKVNINNKKDIKVFKKMLIQILICLAIYCVFYLIKNNNYIFSEDFLNQSKAILAYDVNFQEIYTKTIDIFQNKNQSIEYEKEEQETEKDTEEVKQDAIGGADKDTKDEEVNESNELSQMEQDAIEIKKTISFINPIEGTITSKFGWRNPTTNTVPKYHTGLDIANVYGTLIRSATEGDVVLTSSEGDYRKTYKNTN